MTTPQWENLPQPIAPPTPGAAAWAGFAVDPRLPESAGLRASNSDRDLARSVLTRARNSGRLTAEEFSERMEATRQATFVGELAPLLTDVIIEPVTTSPLALASAGRFAGFPGWWLRLTLLLNVIWLVTCFTSGHILYYWPIWPMLGTAVPAFLRGEFGPRRHAQPQLSNPPEQLPPDATDLR